MWVAALLTSATCKTFLFHLVWFVHLFFHNFTLKTRSSFMRVLLVKLLSTIFVVLFLVKHVLKNYPRDFIL